MRKFTIPFLVLTIISGIYGFAGYDLWANEAARVIFLIAADLFVVSLFARIFFYTRSNPEEQTQANNVEV